VCATSVGTIKSGTSSKTAIYNLILIYHKKKILVNILFFVNKLT